MEYSTHAPTHAKAIQDTVQREKQKMATSIASQSTLALAKAHLATWTKGNEKTLAGTSKTNINSIFDAAKKAIDDAKTKGKSIQDNATQTMNDKKANIESIGQKNADAIKKVIEDNDAIVKYQAEIQKKTEERKQKETEVKRLGGEIQNKDKPEEEDVTQEVKTKDGSTKTVKTKKQKKTNGDPAKQEKINQLNNEIKVINGEISKTQQENIVPLVEDITVQTAEFTKNTADMVADKGVIEATRAQADGEIKATQTNMQNSVMQQDQKLNKEIQEQTAKETKNTADAKTADGYATTLQIELEAQQAESSIPVYGTVAQATNNSAEIQQTITKLQSMDSDLNMTGGAAKDNAENKTNAKQYQEQIKTALSQAVNNDFTSFTNTINQIYNDAILAANEQLAQSMPGVENINTEGGTPPTNAGSESPGGSSGGGILGSSIGKAIGSSVGGMMGSVIGNAIGGEGGQIFEQVAGNITGALFS